MFPSRGHDKANLMGFLRFMLHLCLIMLLVSHLAPMMEQLAAKQAPQVRKDLPTRGFNAMKKIWLKHVEENLRNQLLTISKARNITTNYLEWSIS